MYNIFPKKLQYLKNTNNKLYILTIFFIFIIYKIIVKKYNLY
jgi:hypothetical protein